MGIEFMDNDDDENIKSEAEILKETLAEFFSKKDIETKTDLFVGEDAHFAFLDFLSKRLKWTNLKKYVDYQLVYRLSRERKSRMEYTEGMKTVDLGKKEEHNTFGKELWSKLIG